MARKAVKSISISGISGPVISATVFKGESVEVDKVGSFNDTHFTSVPRSIKSYGEFRFTVLDEGGASALSALVGTVVNVTVSTQYSDGASGAATNAVTHKMVVKSAEPGGEISVDGDRKSTVVVVCVPHA